MLKIVATPNPLLQTVSRPVKRIDKKVRVFIRNMEETLVAQEDPQGVGLAAVQVGWPIRIFIMKPAPSARIEVCVNPEIVKLEGLETPLKRPKNSPNKKRGSLEGCLSIARVWGQVNRAQRVHLKFQNAKGVEQTKIIGGFRAVIVQHEMDHLNGILFTQRVLEQKHKLYEEIDGKLEKMRY